MSMAKIIIYSDNGDYNLLQQWISIKILKKIMFSLKFKYTIK